MTMPPPGAQVARALNVTSISSSDARPSAQAAAILPLTTALRGAGVASSGSRDWRSRSPAVASRITAMPPRNADRISRYGNNIAASCPRLASADAMSRTPTLNGRTTPGSMPRASSRSVPIWSR